MSDAPLPAPTAPSNQRLTGVQWLTCAMAAIGFMFDIYVLLMLPLILKPALAALGGMAESGAPLLLPGSADYNKWARLLFFIPAIAGGVFGLIGGYLTDRLGRRRVLTYSILLYAGAALGSAFVTTLLQLLVLRCLIFVGVCVEFVAAVAWLAELFPNPTRREKVLGYTQAFSSFGGLLVAGANEFAAHYASSLPAIHGGHDAWRYTLLSGVIPAIPLILIRPFLPESPEWQRKRETGTLKRPSFGELFSPGLIRTTVVTTLVFAASYGMAFGAIQQLPQILGAQALNTPAERGHAAVIATAKEAVKNAAGKAKAGGKDLSAGQKRQIGGNASDEAVAKVQFWQENGGLVGRILLAILAVIIISRRALLWTFQVPAMVVIPALFYWISTQLGNTDSLPMIKWGMALAGMLVVSQFSFWGNYIPLVFPLHLRGTGESFAANIGGRVLGTGAAWITITLSASDPPNPAKMAATGAMVAGAYALVGVILTAFLPEPKPEDRPE